MTFPIVPVLEHYSVEVRESGRSNVQVLCPVHDEAVPSCSVNIEEGLAHCFACGFGGSAIEIIMAKEGCDRGAAVSKAEEITGTVREDVSRTARPERVGLSGRTRAFKPKYRNTPPRSRTFTTT